MRAPLLSTKAKIALARPVQRAVVVVRRRFGGGPCVRCRRGGLSWRLDLREGIDFAIFLLGSFEARTVAAYRAIVAPGATVIDIGANIGAHTLPLAACVGPRGRVVAVEPTGYAFARLCEHVRLNQALADRITPVQAMLMGTADAVVPEWIESSWPLDTPAGAHPRHAGVAKPTVGALPKTLDRLVEDLGLAAVDFLKLDVDGYEVEVLRGATRTLSRHSPTIVFEHAPYTVVEKGYDPAEFADILKGAGYGFADLRRRPLRGDGELLPEMAPGTGINLLAIPRRRCLAS